MTTNAEIVIKGRNELGLAVRQAEQQLKGLAKQGELVGKVLRGGAIAGAILAFDRLAKAAEESAKQIGDEGTARALHSLNKQIDILKSKGTNIIGSVLGGVYVAAGGGDEIDQMTLKLANLSKERDLLLQGVSGDRSKVGPGFVELEKQIAATTERLELYKKALSAGNRLRAPGSHGGGQALRERPDLIEPNAKAPTTDEILARMGLGADIPITVQRITQDAVSSFYQSLNDATKTAQEKQIDEWIDYDTQIQDLVSNGIITAAEGSKRIAENVNAQFEDIQVTAKHIFPEQEQVELSVMADQAGRDMHKAFADFLFDPFHDGLKGMVAGFADSVRRMVAEAAAAQILQGFFSFIGGGATTGVRGFFTGLAKSAGRATGGPVMAGVPYMVGERGKEMFVPSSSGTIIPNGGSAGGVTIINNIDAKGADAERIFAVLPGLLKQNSDQTIARIRDMNGRGRF